jgi:hypothetical protein
MEPQKALTGPPLPHRKASEGASDAPRTGSIPWSRPVITRFALERTLTGSGPTFWGGSPTGGA